MKKLEKVRIFRFWRNYIVISSLVWLISKIYSNVTNNIVFCYKKKIKYYQKVWKSPYFSFWRNYIVISSLVWLISKIYSNVTNNVVFCYQIKIKYYQKVWKSPYFSFLAQLYIDFIFSGDLFLKSTVTWQTISFLSFFVIK